MVAQSLPVASGLQVEQSLAGSVYQCSPQTTSQSWFGSRAFPLWSVSHPVLIEWVKAEWRGGPLGQDRTRRTV